MAAIRHMVVEHYSMPCFLGRIVNDPKALPFVFLVSALLLVAAIAAGGSFTPQATPVRYASMLPHLTLDLFFLAATGFAAVTALIGAARAWKAFAGEPLWRAKVGHLVLSVCGAVREILTHRKFSQCEQFPLSRWAHVCVFYGFLTLFVLGGLVAMLIPFGVPYPFPVLHPLKVVGNLGGVLLILGNVYFLHQRRRASRNGDPSSWFDWVLLLDLLLVSVTGMLAELFRYTNIAALAYPTFFVHLVFVFVLLVGLPYSKLAHVVYRTLALVARRYGGFTEIAGAHQENRSAAV
jgi:quinone-modifying oxidoreductase subunit QmoC